MREIKILNRVGATATHTSEDGTHDPLLMEIDDGMPSEPSQALIMRMCHIYFHIWYLENRINYYTNYQLLWYMFGQSLNKSHNKMMRNLLMG